MYRDYLPPFTGSRGVPPLPRQRTTSGGSRLRGTTLDSSVNATSGGLGQTAGLSVYFSLSNFSLFIFHPYGGSSMVGKKTPSPGLLKCKYLYMLWLLVLVYSIEISTYTCC